MPTVFQFQPDESVESTPYQMIYAAAKTYDQQKIAAALEKACIDVIDNTYLAPVARLAYENNQTAVDFLRTHYQASTKWAIFGYALALNFPVVEKLLRENPQQRAYLLREVVYAYTYRDRQDLAKEILANNPDQSSTLIESYAFGCGHGGIFYEDITIDIPEEYTNKFIQNLCIGYGWRGQQILADFYVRFWQKRIPTILASLARAYATMQNTKAITNLLKKYPDQRFLLLPEIIFGYAHSRALPLLNTLFKTGEVSEAVALENAYEGLLGGGHLAEADLIRPLILRDNIPSIITTLTLNGHHAHAKKLLSQHPTQWPDAIFGFVTRGELQTVMAYRQTTPALLHLVNNELIAGLAALNKTEEVTALMLDNLDDTEDLLARATEAYASHGYHQSWQALLDLYPQYQSVWPFILRGLARENLYQEALVLLKDSPPELMKHVAEEFIEIQSYYLAAAMLKDLPKRCQFLLHCMAGVAKLRMTTQQEALLYLLTIPEPNFRRQLVHKIQKDFPNAYDYLHRLLPRVQRLAEIIQREKIDLAQAQAWLDPTVQILILQGHLLVDKTGVSADAYFVLMSFYTGLQTKQIYELGRKMENFLALAATPNLKPTKANLAYVLSLNKTGNYPCALRANYRQPLADRTNTQTSLQTLTKTGRHPYWRGQPTVVKPLAERNKISLMR